MTTLLDQATASLVGSGRSLFGQTGRDIVGLMQGDAIPADRAVS